MSGLTGVPEESFGIMARKWRIVESSAALGLEEEAEMRGSNHRSFS
jgi:hypothetical protein